MMISVIKKPRKGALLTLALAAGLLLPGSIHAEPLKIGYSDWPGWVAYEIGIKKEWFKEEGVEVEFEWYDYVASMDAYAAGQLDGVGMTNGDALVTGPTGKPSVGILINDYSNGNDMIVAKPGIDSIKDLDGMKIGLEEGFVPHLLLLKGLEMNDMEPDSVTVVNTPTNETPQVLSSGAVDAISAWQPSSGQALKVVSGSKPIYTSADAPGIIYDILFVDPESLEKRRDDWKKVIKVWYKIVEFIRDEDNLDETLEILASRVSVSPEEYEPFLDGTYILNGEEVKPIWEKGEGLESVYGSTVISNEFNVNFEVYEKALDVEKYFDPSLTLEVLEEMEK